MFQTADVATVLHDKHVRISYSVDVNPPANASGKGQSAAERAAFERFERYCPYGTADDIAEFLAPYAAAGCTEFNLIPQSPDQDQAIAGAAAVKRLLARQ